MKQRIAQWAAAAGVQTIRVRNPRPKSGQQVLHFLHIGKNAGTQVKLTAQALGANNPQARIVTHGHDVQLRHLPKGAAYFFSIRNPVSRFKSGFYNRRNKGLPVRLVDWSADEARAFATFDHANDLAEALFAGGALGAQAWAAMASLRHAGQHQSDWFLQRGAFLETHPPVHILRTENFVNDFSDLARKVNLPSDVMTPGDKSAARVTDYGDIPALSDKAVANLNQWYDRDAALYAMCEDWILAHPPSAT